MPEAGALHGWLVIDKPVGPGSTEVVSAVKRALRSGGYPKAKVGHGGTLDPLASGVLPIALGEATKLAGRLLDSDKAYEFTVAFGSQTDTLDAEGTVTCQAPLPTVERVSAALRSLKGPIDQVPPAYSALKIDGERAYDLARAGAEVALAPRAVVIHDLYSTDRLGGAEDDGRVAEAHLRAFVSKGTYVRSLARDIASHAGSVGYVTRLRRIVAGPFSTVHAITLDKLAGLGQARALEQLILPLRAGLDDIPALVLTPDQAGSLRQGRVLAGTNAADGVTFATLHDVPVALVEVRDGEVRVIRGFNL